MILQFENTVFTCEHLHDSAENASLIKGFTVLGRFVCVRVGIHGFC